MVGVYTSPEMHENLPNTVEREVNARRNVVERSEERLTSLYYHLGILADPVRDEPTPATAEFETHDYAPEAPVKADKIVPAGDGKVTITLADGQQVEIVSQAQRVREAKERAARIYGEIGPRETAL